MKLEHVDRHLAFPAWAIHAAGVDTVRFSPAQGNGAVLDTVIVYQKHWQDRAMLQVCSLFTSMLFCQVLWALIYAVNKTVRLLL